MLNEKLLENEKQKGAKCNKEGKMKKLKAIKLTIQLKLNYQNLK